MSDQKKYRTGNQSEEHVLLTDYLGWKPDSFKDWYDAATTDAAGNRRPRPFPLTLVNQDGTQSVAIIMHQWFIKDAFPLEFFGEERARDWDQFAIVSLETEPWALFIIPLH